MSDQDIIDEIITEMGKAFEFEGYKPLIGEVWATLYFKGEMTQEELKKELNAGLSSISESLKTLQNLGNIKIINKRGRRRVYSAETNFHEIILKRLDNAIRYHFEPINSLLNNKISSINNKDTKNKAVILKSRYSKTASLMKLMLKTNQR